MPGGVAYEAPPSPASPRLRDVVRDRFAGQEFDVYVGVHLAGGRVYDAHGGRLLNVTSPGVSIGDPNPFQLTISSPAGVNSQIVRMSGGDSGRADFWELYFHYLNPENNEASDNGSAKVAKYFGWIAGSVLIATYGIAGTAAGLAAAGVTSTTALVTGTATITAAGVGSSVASAYISNPNAGLHEYAIAAGGGAANPFGSMGGLALGGIGAGIAHYSGWDARKGFMIGDMVGNLVGGGVDDLFSAMGKGDTFAEAAIHAGKYAAVQLGFGAAGAGIGYLRGGIDGALYGGQIGSTIGGIAANFLVACFAEGTPILVSRDGKSRRAETLRKNDLLVARSEFDPEGPLELKRIEEVFVRVAPVVALRIGGQTVRTTAEHPFYALGRGWTPAGELTHADQLLTLDGRWLYVESVESTGEVVNVYNFRVADHHTYFVGGEEWGFAVWAHNTYLGRRETKAYLDEVDSIAKNRTLTNSQRAKIYDYLKNNSVEYIGPEAAATRRDSFDSAKRGLISLWEEKTGQSWPRYRADVPAISANAVKPFRQAGNYYDAHEIIPNSYGGPLEWWNIHPAKGPSQHQAGIHAADGLFRHLFPLDR